MKDLKQLLADGDPVAREAGSSPIEAAGMRRVILAAVVEPAPQPVAGSWPRPFVMAAAVAACLLIGVSVGLRLNPEPPTQPAKPSAGADAQGERRQLQFVTTGGTRIIWTFHEHFEL
jgi:hypothetical protein